MSYARTLSVALALLAVPVPAAAQAPWTGWDVALHGAATVPAGGTARLRGTTLHVRGIAELVPEATALRARVRGIDDEARAPSWVDATSDAEGRFTLALPVPPALDGAARVELEIGPERRAIEIPVRARPAVTLDLTSDRRLYEPGEPVHVFGILRDRATGRPLADRAVRLDVEEGPIPHGRHAQRTGPSGAVHLELAVPDGAGHGEASVSARLVVDGEAGPALDTARFAVGTRTYERMLAEVEIEPAPVAPGDAATVRVRVTTPSGAPVSDAEIAVTVDGDTRAEGTSGADGVAVIATRAPVHATHDTGRILVEVEIHHPGHGSLTAYAHLHLAVPLALSVEVIPRFGGVVPEIDDHFWVRLRDGVGEPPPEGTRVTVEGGVVRGGRATATTDAAGLVEIPTRAPLGVASSSEGREPRATLRITAAGALEREVRTSIPVLRDAEVAPTVDRVVVEPGSSITVTLARRPRVARRPVVVELLDEGAPIAVRWAPARTDRVTFDVPARLGIVGVRARVVHADEVMEGAGATTVILVRPPRPDFVSLSPERPRWTVGETARVELATAANAGPTWAAVAVRDLAAHGGEVPFQQHFLGRLFEEAILAPSPAGDRLVRAALAAHAAADPAPDLAAPLVDDLGIPRFREVDARADAREVLRDPFPLARALERHHIARAARHARRALILALHGGTLESVTTGTGASRRLAEDLLAELDLRTMGGAPITPAMLEALDPSFRYEHFAAQVARRRLAGLMLALSRFLDPGDDAPPAARMASREPPSRWLSRLLGELGPHVLDDPWGGRFELRPTRAPALVLGAHATGVELASAGPDRRFGTRDDIRDPFARIAPEGSLFAVLMGEDQLMRRISVLDVSAATLAAIFAAYDRVTPEMTEEEIGDAVAAETSEGTIGLGNMGTIGHGAGSGSGSGYGRGAGGLRGRSARTPRVRMGTTSLNLASLVRERFPPTLLFRAPLVVEDDGTTTIDIPLADAVTTFLVEAIVWRADGWTWSASTRIEVDRDVVVDAPVPPIAHVGDRLRLPLRVSNRSATPRELTVQLRGDPALGVEASPRHTLTVAPNAAEVVPIEIALGRRGAGRLTVVALDAQGEPVDAVRRPIEVVAPARTVERERDALASDEVRIELHVPRDADPREGQVRLGVGRAMFDAPASQDAWTAWVDGGALSEPRALPEELAVGIGARWGRDEVDDEAVRDLAHRLTQALAGNDGEGPDPVRARAWALLGLAPAHGAGTRRAVPEVEELVERVRRDVASRAVTFEEDPETWIAAAAALSWTGGAPARVRELLRRAERHVVRVGDDRWLPTADTTIAATLLAAAAEVGLGRDARAFAYLATVARHAADGHALSSRERALARVIADRLTHGEGPREAEVWVDGERATVSLETGAAHHDAPALARPGSHDVRVIARGAPIFVRAVARFGVPWTETRGGPFALALEGEVGGLDATSDLTLDVLNRVPRTVARPVVEVDLPTGAELVATEVERLRRRGVGVERGGGVLRLTLPPLLPGRGHEIPLRIRWSVAGELDGLGVAAFAADRPDRASVLAPRRLTIEGAP